MKQLLLALLLGIAFNAIAAEPAELLLSIHESRTIRVFGATAAWPVDASIVDVAAQKDDVTFFGRAAGRTKVIVVSIAGQATYDVVVQPRAGLAAATPAKPRGERVTAEARYSSGTRELQNSVTVAREEKDKRTEVQVRTVHYGGAPTGDRAKTSVPSASIRLFRRNRELTLLDRDVDHSPLTLSNTPVRGIHYLDDRWRLYAGYTAYAAYGSLIVPVERELVAGAGYAIRTGPHATLTPGLFAYRGEGTVASLLYDYADEDHLALRAELGYSRGIGGALQLWYDANGDRARADVRYRPDEFAVAGAGNPRGLLADASWAHEYGRRSTASLQLAASSVAGTSVRAVSADVEHRLSDRLALTGGASWGSFGDKETLTVPVGARLDFSRGGIAALYRYAESATNRGGQGFRLSARASIGRLHASAYADRQQNAPTLDVIFSEVPELAAALEQLGITATTPADIARALRDNAALIELGYIDGVTVDLAPLRTQLGFELAFLGGATARQQLRARVVRSVTESVAQRTATTIASLTYSRALARGTDVFAAYNYYRIERRGQEAQVEPYIEAGIRHSFDGLPSVFASGRITGVVFADEDLDGRSDGQPVAAEVELDGVERKRTAADGTFEFTRLASGTHRITARVPERPDAYFTTPSRVEAQSGERVSFGVASTPARVSGRVIDDAGSGIGGVRVLLARGANQVIAETKSDGSFALIAAPGEWQLSILTDSVPAGHSLAGAEARTLMLDRAQPLQSDFTLRAHRSISGSGAEAHAEVVVQPGNRRVRADAEGKFSIRSLSPGEVTIVAGGIPHRVVVPSGPASLSLDVSAQVAATEPPPVRTVVTGEVHDQMHWLVAVGAFRVHANALDTVERARRAGVPVTMRDSGALTLVHAGPFASRGEAAAAALRLTKAGLEAVIVSRK